MIEDRSARTFGPSIVYEPFGIVYGHVAAVLLLEGINNGDFSERSRIQPRPVSNWKQPQ